MKLYRDNKFVVLLDHLKSIIGRQRAFKMLQKGINRNEPIINSKIHRSIK